MPKLWNETIRTHRHAVIETILDTTWRLVAEQGLRAITMSQIAQETGIARATLYRYFPDVEAILLAWHERHIAIHLEELTALRHRGGDPWQRLERVLEAYAFISRRRAGELGALLHRGEKVAQAHQELTDLVRDLLAEAARAGSVRNDIDPAELAGYCLHALGAAASVPSDEGVHRLVTLTLAGLTGPAGTAPGQDFERHPERHAQRHEVEPEARHEQGHQHGLHGRSGQHPQASQ
ncbi:TetR/AcrR family transcriptional regulator [Pseudarthrobacter sp. S9]|uniref:TetR/AcrR family transcriptional regulator n=1 Tax=Pseudarthrobacter sp. S9 TaxID=3418421 RepID=UPI003D0531EE